MAEKSLWLTYAILMAHGREKLMTLTRDINSTWPRRAHGSHAISMAHGREELMTHTRDIDSTWPQEPIALIRGINNI